VLRSNLSTRPFYNERAVDVLMGLIAIVVLALTAFNIYRIVTLSRQNTEISTRASRDRDEANRLAQEASKVRRGMNQNELKVVAAAAREANYLIDQRTFSWTEFFNQLETTLPPDVMLSSVRPTITENGTRVMMIVLGRRVEDIDEFMWKLEATGAFIDVIPAQDEVTDDGLHKVTLESFYTPEGAEPATSNPQERQSAPKPAPKSGAQP
jgi:hypothetical protein